MGITLITFFTPNFRYAKNTLVASARKYGVHNIHTYTSKDFTKTAFYKSHIEIAAQPRGAGYWLWKPYYILQ